MRRLAAVLLVAGLPLATAATLRRLADDARTIEAAMHHLGNDVVKDWPGVPEAPEGMRLSVRFDATRNEREQTLLVRQRDVDDVWTIELNGAAVGVLDRRKPDVTRPYAIPAGALRDGENELVIAAPKGTDDIALGEIRLVPRPLREHLKLRRIAVRVTEGRTGKPTPARITIAGPGGASPEIRFPSPGAAAVRDGVLYTTSGEVSFEVPEGGYDLFATRGAEWGLARAHMDSGVLDEVRVGLSIDREVDTAGWIAADTHLHTFTFSGHGDSTVEERVATLAGEGVELAIATDHNHHTDYRPLQSELGLGAHFTAVTGNEVTSDNGHFNAFPFAPGVAPPPHQEKDWVKLVDGIRAKGATVVILNHPRWPKLETGPLGVFGMDRTTGVRTSGPPRLPVDAMELVNSTALLDDPLYLFTDWFALLNHGERIFAVGSSDSHTVGDPVGLGRTYVRSATDVPSAIDVGEACRSFTTGALSVSLGMFADARVADGGIGSTVSVSDGRIEGTLRIASASWVRPRKILLFLDGWIASEIAVELPQGRPTDLRVPIALTAPPHDAYLVCVVLGDEIRAPFWRSEQPYTLAATNPIWLDRDGDGVCDAPRVTARRLLGEGVAAPEAIVERLARCDDAVAIQMVQIASETWGDDLRAHLATIARSVPPERGTLREFLARAAR